MLDLGESLERLTTHAPRGRVGGDETGEARFKVDKPRVELIVLAVADGWRRFLVIAAIVLLDFTAQLGDSL